MKHINSVIGSISALAGILLVILIGVNSVLVQESFLNYTNQKYSVEQNLSMTEEDLQKAVHGMISYVKGKADTPQVTVQIKEQPVDFFNEKEIGHLEDVRLLLENVYASMWIMLVVCVVGAGYLIYKKQYLQIQKGVKRAWLFLLAISLVVGLLAIIDIDLVVTGFHKMFLSDSQWILNPALDRSVWMFRSYMYADVLLALAGIVVATAAISIGPLVAYKLKKNNHKKR